MFYQLAEKALALERKGMKIVRLNVGDTNLPAPACAVAAAEKWMKSGKGGYVSSAGLQEFREAIAEREKCGIENVVVGAGSKHLIFALLSVLAKKRRSAAFPSPHWPAYPLACGQLGLEGLAVGTSLEAGWQFEKIPAADVAIICNPLNPTGTIYGDGLMRRTLASARESGMQVILDEAYRGLSFEKIPVYEDAIRVRSFSKEFSMESWRLGYAVAPEEIVKKVVEFNQITETCVAPFVQQAGAACLLHEKEILSEAAGIWKGRMGAAARALRKEGFRFAKPQSAMYIFATHGAIDDSEKYALGLLEKGVAVAPGSDFGDYPAFVRVCANQPEDALEKAIGIMGEAAK